MVGSIAARDRILVTVFVMVLTILAGCPAARGSETASPVPPRFLSDTIYHAVLDLATRQMHVSYGPYVLVDCAWSSPDTSAPRRFAAERQDADVQWTTITERSLWVGRQAMPEREVEVVARSTNADPSLIRRVLPDRFTIELTNGRVLRVVTETGVLRGANFAEWLHRWIRRPGLFSRHRCLEITVTEADAQTLYYALEPGTPVVVIPVGK